MESNLVQQNTSSSVQESIDEHITCRTVGKTASQLAWVLDKQLAKVHMVVSW